MNILKDHFIQRQIKENAVYFLLTAGLIVSFFVSVAIFTGKKLENDTKKVELAKDIHDLKSQAEFINYQAKIEGEGVNIDMMNQLLSALVPEKEDYFSIITALESLSQKTGFIITSYSLNLSETKRDRLSLAIEGTGDQTAFLNFLDQYTFGGGRLITIDKIDYTTQGFFTIRLSVNLYSGKGVAVKEGAAVNFSDADRELLRNIQEKFTLDVLPFDTQVASGEYETKTNPF